MLLDEDGPAFEAVCVAVAVNCPQMPLREVKQSARHLADDRRVAYTALCVSLGTEPQETLTALVSRVLGEQPT